MSGEPAVPKPAMSEDDEADEPDTTPEETAEAVEEIESADSAEPGAFFDGEEEAEVELDLADTDIGKPAEKEDDDRSQDAGAFDGVEESTSKTKQPPEETAKKAVEGASDTLSTNINSGAAHLATVGLPDEFEHHGEMQTKDDLRDEFEEIFETFKLGHYGEEVAAEYLFIEGEEIDPLTGFTVSMVAATTMVMMMRPDSDEILGKVKSKVNSNE